MNDRLKIPDEETLKKMAEDAKRKVREMLRKRGKL